jgi:heme o synthase
MRLNRFAKYAWFVLVFNIGVILWGAFVRATGSGAGCGNHWPLCDGVVIPASPQFETMVELTHRATSGIAMLLVAGMLVWAFKAYPKGHRVRFGASLSSIFIIIEALLGASLVLFGWVGEDDSAARAVSISLHLVNTFILLAFLSLTAWWASGGQWVRLRGQGIRMVGLGIAVAAMFLIGMSGAITALGDTLFPAESISDVLSRERSETNHFLKDLRVWHPVIAIVAGFYIAFMAGLFRMLSSSPQVQKFSMGLIGLYIIQLIAGGVNVILLAPVWMQLVHLLLADLVWILLVLLSAAVLAVGTEQESVREVPSPRVITADR